MIETCKHCGELIELNAGIWWIAGSHRWLCGSRGAPFDEELDHEPRVPDLTDRPAVEQWLDA